MAFEKHYIPLLRLCALLSGSRAEAEDIVQEAFVKVAPKIGELEQEAIGPYLRRIVVNLWRNQRRRLATEIRALGRLWVARSVVEGSTEEHDEVWRLVFHLPPRRRACVVLRYYEDLPEAEVAAVLGCSVGTVKSQTSRALATLQKELEHGH